MFQVFEHYNGATKVLYETDDEADALSRRDWEREQWSCSKAASESVYVKRKR